MAKQSKPGPRKKTTKYSTKSAGAEKTSAGSSSARKPSGYAGNSKPGQKKGASHKGSPRKSVRTVPERDLEADMEAREALLEGSLEQVYSVYEEAIDDGVHLPVVFLVDCEDQLGGKLARDWVGREEVDEAIEANRAASKNTLTTTFAQCLPFQDCQEDVPKMFDYLQGSFQQAPPEGTFIAIVVACGGAATFFVPYEGQEED